MHVAYIKSRKQKEKPKKVLWMELRYAKRLADKNADFLKANGLSKEEYIKRILES